MEIYRLRELIELSIAYMQIGFSELEAIRLAEKELEENERFNATFNI